MAQLQVQRRELDVSGAVIARRHQEVLLTQHAADGVELGRANALDAVADAGVGQAALCQARVQGDVDAGVKEEAPVEHERLLGAEGRELVRLGAHQEHDRVGEVPFRRQA